MNARSIFMDPRITLILISFIAFIVAYILGLVIVGTVDRRLSEISINMPAITLPKIHINAENGVPMPLDQGPINYSVSRNDQIGAGTEMEETEQKNDQKNDQKNEQEPVKKTCIRPVDVHIRTRFNSSRYHSESEAVEKPAITVPTDIRMTNESPAPYPPGRLPVHTLEKKQLVPTYYRNPKEMTLAQRLKFKTSAKLEKMTVEDYENWLLLYKEDPENLDKFHRDKLRVLLRGGRLTIYDLPKGESRTTLIDEESLTAEARFNRAYSGHITNLPQSETGGLHAYNYDQYDSYTPPINLKHLSTFNPDEILKTEDDELLRPILSYKQSKHDSRN